MKTRTLGMMLAVTMVFGATAACILVDDDDDDFNDTEIVTVENLTSEDDVEFFFDDRYEATLNGLGTFSMEGHLEGTHELYADSPRYEWGPDTVRIRDADHITWTLDLERARPRQGPRRGAAAAATARPAATSAR
ncbi:MAG: hypothetical protein HYV63_29810 [Candidatus Schekmanbacteria bacterium]|nr:hypothetical protein [Candidatus Schekmanbacteria bacterium]